MKNIISLMVFISCTFLQAQNLVLNPSFESYTPIAQKEIAESNAHFLTLAKVQYWYSPTVLGTPDHYSPLHQPKEVKVHHQKAYSGKAFAAIYAQHEFNYEYREYLAGSLSQPLQADATYEVSFYVRLDAQSSLTTPHIDVFLTQQKPFLYGNADFDKSLPVIPQLKNDDTQFLTQTHTWQKITHHYLAKGGEQTLIIGNFNALKQTVLKKVPHHEEDVQQAYYHIDEVSVVLKTPAIPKNIPKDTLYNALTEHKKVTLPQLPFEPNQAILPSQADSVLRPLVLYLKQFPTLNICIVGHTDSGTQNTQESYLEQLSTQRAQAVYNYCIKQGVSPTQLSYKGLGSKEPIADNNTLEGRQQNRRIEIIRLP